MPTGNLTNKTALDTDQFPYNINELTGLYLLFWKPEVCRRKWSEFRCKNQKRKIRLIRRLVLHIGGMDLFARALITTDKILENLLFTICSGERYQSF